MKPALLRVVSVTRETSLALTSLIPQVPLCQVHSVLTRFSRAPVGEIGSLRSAGPGWGTGGNAAQSRDLVQADLLEAGSSAGGPELLLLGLSCAHRQGASLSKHRRPQGGPDPAEILLGLGLGPAGWRAKW